MSLIFARCLRTRDLIRKRYRNTLSLRNKLQPVAMNLRSSFLLAIREPPNRTHQIPRAGDESHRRLNLLLGNLGPEANASHRLNYKESLSHDQIGFHASGRPNTLRYI